MPDVPRFTCVPAFEKHKREFRGSAHERGYDNDWKRLRSYHLKVEPLCRECYFRGRKTPADMVNHNIPVRHAPDLRLDRANLSSMCKLHHDTVIAELERLAESMNDIEALRLWLADPVTRPGHHGYQPKGFPRLLRDANRPLADERR